MKELEPRFDFKTIDAKWSDIWVKENLFHAQPNKKKEPFTVVIPPPNVTGILHMGHALNNTLQDIIIRYKRMNNFEACWMPGTDHAGIATQNVVEKQLAKEGKRRHDLGREEFLKRLWSWKNQYGDTIIEQLKKIGASCDWPRTRFTMDDEYSHAVRKVFVDLYKKDLIYKGEYIINWCPRCQTALSDEEAEHQETQGNLYHLRYPLKDGKGYVIVATTRPETMLGDTAVAVNPKDKRYKKLIGQKLILPIIKREIAIIADDFVDAEFGSGAVKVTPAHDPNDFAMGKRHNLEFVNVMHPDGKMNDNAGAFKGIDRFEARKRIVEMLQDQDLLERIEPHTHAVGHCYRCHTIVEPYLSKQWFVKMAPLAKKAKEVVENGKVTFYPDRWTKVYLNWMDGIRDWCISRQIWWGHRIPAWYCLNEQCQEIIVSMDDVHQCPKCKGKSLRQDEDVLDTWFSSWLWPFATFGWPANNEDTKYFYPGNCLFTASEIIFFWVARMIMAGIEFMGDVPFTQVYIHGTVRDAQGRKMSKSLGNAIDPLEIVAEYGADALRFSLIMNSGQDLFISKEKFESGRNFANKIWNATRLILMNAKDGDTSFELSDIKDLKKLDLPTQWIISKFYLTAEKVGDAIERFRYSDGENLIQEFFWSNFCDWYLEIIKDRLSDAASRQIAIAILKESLKIMHPFIPFVTEELWEKLAEGKGRLCVQSWPAHKKNSISEESLENMQILIDLITQMRTIRSQWNIKKNDSINSYLATTSTTHLDVINTYAPIIKTLAKVETLSINDQLPQEKNMAMGVINKVKLGVPLGQLIDVEQEKQRILKDIQSQEAAQQKLAGLLGNESFRAKAPKEAIEKEEKRLSALDAHISELKNIIKNLN